MKTLRKGSAIAVVAAAALALGACSKGTSTSESTTDSETTEKVEISYVHRLPNADGVDALVKKWNEENPNIQVKAEKFPGEAKDFMPQLKQNVADGTAACLAQVGYAELPNAFVDGILEDVTAHVTDADKETYKGTIDLMKIGESFYGIPQDNGPLVYLYDKAAFEALGLTVPTTAAEFIETAKKAAAAGKYIVSYQTDEIGNMFGGLAAAAGGAWYGGDTEGFTVNVLDKGTEALADFWQQILDAKAASVVARWDATQFDAAIKEGKLIGTFAAGWEAGLIPDLVFGINKDNVQDGTWAAALLPDFGAGQLSGPDGGSGVAVVKGCAHPAEAMKFNSWFNDQVDALAGEQGLVPASTTPAATPEFVKKFYGGQDVYELLAEANGKMAPVAFIPGWSEVTTAMVTTGADVTSGAKKVIDIFKAADETSKTVLEKGGFTVK
ncbi:MAG: extracellular solute-binding protein [Arcanobacterium sp.]|nr:extracellular solute-binding protein [Arcanobacterium sp.]